MSNDNSLAGCRVLVAEDEAFIALMLEDFLTECGCKVIGPTDDFRNSVLMATSESMDFAILDVRLGNDDIYPTAEILEKRGIPFLLLSGYGSEAAPRNKLHWATCGKPFTFDQLLTAIAGLRQPTKELQH